MLPGENDLGLLFDLAAFTGPDALTRFKFERID